MCRFSPVRSASWRSRCRIIRLSFPPCSCLFSLPRSYRPPALHTMGSCLFLTVQDPGSQGHPGPAEEKHPGPPCTQRLGPLPGRTPFHSFGLSRAASSGGSTREENQLGIFQLPIQPETKGNHEGLEQELKPHCGLGKESPKEHDVPRMGYTLRPLPEFQLPCRTAMDTEAQPNANGPTENP